MQSMSTSAAQQGCCGAGLDGPGHGASTYVMLGTAGGLYFLTLLAEPAQQREFISSALSCRRGTQQTFQSRVLSGRQSTRGQERVVRSVCYCLAVDLQQ